MAGQPVSGPGALSRRTDKGPVQKIMAVPGGDYGDRQQFDQLQHDAPLAQSPGPSAPASGAGGQGAVGPTFGQGLTPLHAPSARPDEPVTAGANSGPGPSLNDMNLPSPTQTAYHSTADFIQSALQSDPNNPSLQFLAAQIGTRL